MARARNRSPADRRDPRRLDAAGRKERGDADLRTTAEKWLDPSIIIVTPWAKAQYDFITQENQRDTRIALRRKLNGDTR